MRIISQDKTEDIPYEMSTICIEAVYPSRICAKQAGLNDILLGKYNSHEDAKTALQSVRMACFSGKKFWIMPTADKVAGERLAREEKNNS